MNAFTEFFLCGLMVIDNNKKIIQLNPYFEEHLQWTENELIGESLTRLFSKPSSIFYESYVMPILLNEGFLQEAELTLLTATGSRIPVVASVRLNKEQGTQYWCFQNASNRHKLYDELLQVREKLVSQNEKLTLLSNTDTLTGLLNRRAFTQCVDQVLSRFKRYPGELTLLILDIDNFKLVNDNFGHDKGDEILSKLGEILQQTTRDTDSVTRFGGEEFAILMPDINSQDSLHLTKRLHKAINTLQCDNKPITVSIGVSDISNCEEVSYERLFKQADEALYNAKRSGKNKTVVFDTSLIKP